MSATWTTRPEVRELLASIAANPPRKRVRHFRFQETDSVYVGQRVAALRCFYLAAEPPVDTPEWRAWLAHDPQAAIAEAIKAGREARAA